MRSALESFPLLKAPGPSGWRAEHLKVCIGADLLDPLATRFFRLLHDTVSFLMVTPLPDDLNQFLFGGALSPFAKPDGGVRPICAGDVLLRIAGKACMKTHGGALRDLLIPNGQVGVAESAGADKIVHAVDLALKANPEWSVVQLDVVNAFNTISRELIYEEVKHHAPFLLAPFLARYGRHTKLQVRGFSESLLSSSGVQQGDPLGPALFALALNAILRDARAADTNGVFRRILALAYLDDLVLCGRPDDVAAALALIQETAAKLRANVVFNAKKCRLWSRSGSADTWKRDLLSSADPSIRWLLEGLDTPAPDEGIVLLGAAIGKDAFVLRHLRNVVATVDGHLQRLDTAIESSQLKYLLLRYAAHPRLASALRLARPSLTTVVAAEYDQVILDSMVRIQGFSSGHELWRKLMHLPQRLGGFGLSSMVDVAPHAFIASVCASSSSILNTDAFSAVAPSFKKWLQIEDAEAADWDGADEPKMQIDTFINNIDVVRLDQPDFAVEFADRSDLIPTSASTLHKCLPGGLQQRMMKIVYESQLHTLLNDVDATDVLKAKILSQQQKGAGAAFDAIPSCNDLTLDNEVFQFLCRSRQCVHELEKPNVPVLCMCGVFEPGEGPRAFSSVHDEHCALGGGTSIRHDPLVSSIAAMLRECGVATRIQSHPQGSKRVYPDIAVADFPNIGQAAYVEVSVICNAQAAVLTQATTIPLFAATKRENEKRTKYAAVALREKHGILAAVFESYGAMGKGLQTLISMCANRVSEWMFLESAPKRTWSSRTFKAFWQQRLAVTFWRSTYQMHRKTAATRLERCQGGNIPVVLSQSI